VVERDPACCGNCPLQAPQRRRSHSLMDGELQETNYFFFVWFDSLSCFSSILHLLPLRSTWVCYLCVQGSLPCLWSSTKPTHQVWFVLEVKRCLKLFLQVLCATLVWPVGSTGLTGVTCEVQCLTGLTGCHHQSDRWSTVSSSVRGEGVWFGRHAYSPPSRRHQGPFTPSTSLPCLNLARPRVSFYWISALPFIAYTLHLIIHEKT
jgi:hypothetical protein